MFASAASLSRRPVTIALLEMLNTAATAAKVLTSPVSGEGSEKEGIAKWAKNAPRTGKRLQ